MRVLLSLCIICVSSLSFGQYALVWADEFDDNELNLNKWSYDLGQGDWGWGNGESQYYTNRLENSKVENGVLKITAKAESYQGYEYTSSRIVSRNKFEFDFTEKHIIGCTALNALFTA